MVFLSMAAIWLLAFLAIGSFTVTSHCRGLPFPGLGASILWYLQEGFPDVPRHVCVFFPALKDTFGYIVYPIFRPTWIIFFFIDHDSWWIAVFPFKSAWSHPAGEGNLEDIYIPAASNIKQRVTQRRRFLRCPGTDLCHSIWHGTEIGWWMMC